MSLTDPELRRLDVWGPEQEAEVASVCEEWLGIALATGPADRPAAEEGVRRAYRASGLAPPEEMVWLGSPLAGAIAATILSVPAISDRAPDDYWRAVRSGLLRRLRRVWVQPPLDVSPGGEGLAAERFGAPVGNQVRGPVADAVRLTLQNEADRRLEWSVEHHPRDGAAGERIRGTGWWLDELVRQGLQPAVDLGWRLRGLVQDVVEPLVEPFLVEDDDEPNWVEQIDWGLERVPLSPFDGVWGQDDVHWLALGAALRRLIPGAGNIRGLDDLMQVARSSGWWWPFEALVILTERPTAVHLDEEGRLHAPDGAAVTYPDGLSIWSWRGVTVPRHVIEQPERITFGHIRDERNVAVRNAMLERYGADRYLRAAGAQRFGSDDVGVLWRADLGDEPLVMVEVRNSTAEPDGTHKHYWLRVPPDVRSAREAVAWTFGLSPGDYRPIVET